MQDFTGVLKRCRPAAMREAVSRLRRRYVESEPVTPADLVIDHTW